jgi:hypothetical protein
VETVLPALPDADYTSHPDRNAAGDVCVYQKRLDGSSALVGVHGGQPIVHADTRDGLFSAIGPLGPVIDAAGNVGFRATLTDGAAAICAWMRGEVQILATSRRDFSGFHGLPVIASGAGVVFRADRQDGTQGIYRAMNSGVSAVFECAAGEGDLARFPAMNSAGEVACGWMDPFGEAHVLRISPGAAVVEVDTGHVRLGALRGCLLGENGDLCFTGTPRDGRLGVYRVLAKGVECLLEEGDVMGGSPVKGFALNPVSISAGGLLAARIRLDDGRQLIAMHR